MSIYEHFSHYLIKLPLLSLFCICLCCCLYIFHFGILFDDLLFMKYLIEVSSCNHEKHDYQRALVSAIISYIFSLLIITFNALGCAQRFIDFVFSHIFNFSTNVTLVLQYSCCERYRSFYQKPTTSLTVLKLELINLENPRVVETHLDFCGLIKVLCISSLKCHPAIKTQFNNH